MNSPLHSALLGVLLAFPCLAAEPEGRFESLGIPVTKAMLMATAVGPDPSGQKDLLYFDFAQTGATLFLVVVDPDTGAARQYKSPVGPGAWALIRGPDNTMYLGTWESGYILRFDPRLADQGIEVIGKPSSTETYIWQYALGQDGKLYGCTYGQAKLISYDPKTGQMQDLGRMDDSQMYTRSIACGPTGKIYTGIGYGRANVVVYDPKTGAHRSILPDKYRQETAASVHQGADGNVYAHCGAQPFRADDETLVPIDAAQVVAPKGLVLRDGRTVTVDGTTASTGTFTLTDPNTGQKTTRTFPYQGDGSLLFVLGLGPQNKIYGSTAMPLECLYTTRPPDKTSTSATPPPSTANSIPCSLGMKNSTSALTPALICRSTIPAGPSASAPTQRTTRAESAPWETVICAHARWFWDRVKSSTLGACRPTGSWAGPWPCSISPKAKSWPTIGISLPTRASSPWLTSPPPA